MKINARRFDPLAKGNTRIDCVSLLRKSANGARSGSVLTVSVTKTPSEACKRSKIGASGNLTGSFVLLLGVDCFQTGLPRSKTTTDTRGAFRASCNSCAVNSSILSSSSKPPNEDEKRLRRARRCERSSNSLARLELSSNSRAFSKATAA